MANNADNTLINLTANEAILLQQVHEDGEDDTRSLSHVLGMSRPHVMAIVDHLRQKGLVAIEGEYDGLWVHLTHKGRQLVNYMWPEALGMYA